MPEIQNKTPAEIFMQAAVIEIAMYLAGKHTTQQDEMKKVAGWLHLIPALAHAPAVDPQTDSVVCYWLRKSIVGGRPLSDPDYFLKFVPVENLLSRRAQKPLNLDSSTPQPVFNALQFILRSREGAPINPDLLLIFDANRKNPRDYYPLRPDHWFTLAKNLVAPPDYKPIRHSNRQVVTRTATSGKLRLRHFRS